MSFMMFHICSVKNFKTFFFFLLETQSLKYNYNYTKYDYNNTHLACTKCVKVVRLLHGDMKTGVSFIVGVMIGNY